MSLAFLPLKLILLGIDLFITLVTFGWVGALKKLLSKEPIRSVPVKDDPSHRVHTSFKGKLLQYPPSGEKTLYEISRNSFEKNASRKCMGSREFLGMEGKKVKKFGPDISWKSYAEVGAMSRKFGAAIRASGVVPAPSTTNLEATSTPCSVAIFENTCAEWMISAQGCFSQSVIVTTIYATLGMEAVVDAINDCSISVLVCNLSNVKRVVENLPEMPTLKTIVYTTDVIVKGSDLNKFLPESSSSVTVISFDDFVESGDTDEFKPIPPLPNTKAVVMYTSGSTGKPKGVIITHSQIVAAIGSGLHLLGTKASDRYIAFLPLAHIMELMVEFSMIAVGACLCYADPKTLTVTGSHPIGALEHFSPTVMVAVPKLWDVIKKGIQAKVAASPPVAQFLVNTAFQARTFAINNGFDTPLFKALVFKKFSKVVGGELRLALSGGGPLNSEVQTFIRTCFGIPLVQGYGLTETNAGLTIQDVSDLLSGVVGVPVPSVEVKVVSCPDIKDKAGNPYLSTDRLDVNGSKVYGRGEVLVKGNSLTVGYYKMPDKTAEVYKEDGFFHTGDVGQFMEDGSLAIIDRVKNMLKLKGGEYIALEKMEMTYGNSKFVDAVNGGICCYGDGDMDRPVALMQLNEIVVMKWAKEKGISGNFLQVKDDKMLYDAVLADMKVEAEKGKLSHLEKLVGLSFLTTPWTPENGCLTAANKLQRRVVVDTFEKEFNEVRLKGIF